jgi:hypothetical protein
LASSTSQTFEGKGKPHCAGTSGSQPVVASVSVDGGIIIPSVDDEAQPTSRSEVSKYRFSMAAIYPE